jgi:murein L,D-transpeptidase YafK
MTAIRRWLTPVIVLLLITAGFYAWLPASPFPPIAIDQIVVTKSSHRMVLMHQSSILRSYQVSLGRGSIGPKTRAGDHRTPEGNYIIDWRNPQSRFHRSLHISFPNSGDLQRAKQLGAAPGGEIMIHGLQNGLGWIGRFHRWIDWTDGCIAVTNSEMDQIWREVPDGTRIEIRP